MTFNYDAYNKVFPKTSAPAAAPIESAVDGYTPTADETNGKAPDLAAVNDNASFDGKAAPAQPAPAQPTAASAQPAPAQPTAAPAQPAPAQPTATPAQPAPAP